MQIMQEECVHDMVAETYAYRKTDNFSYGRLGKAAKKNRQDKIGDMIWILRR